MSQSQHSYFASSLYDGEIDDLSYLSTQQVTPSASQHSIDPCDSSFLLPNDPPPIPSSFTRVGPHRRKAFILYDKMTHNEWVDWWLQTDYGRKSKIKWDSNRNTEIWNSYHQVAHSVDGAPKVMCKRCGKILEHPYSLSPNGIGKAQYHGTSTIQKHLKTAGCLRSENGKKAEITRFLQKEVCLIDRRAFYITILIHCGFSTS